MKYKKSLLGLFILTLITAVTSGVLLWKWNSFQVTSYENYPKEIQADSYEEAAREWITSFMKQYTGIDVPFSYRIKNVDIATVEAQSQDGYYQVDAYVQTYSDSSKLISLLSASQIEDTQYLAQRVLHIIETEDGYQIEESMSPVQYQIRFEVDPSALPASPEYTSGEEENAYVLQNEQLKITYDHGATFVNVPIAYEDITRGNVAYDLNYLQEGSYLVDKEYTAFLYTGEDRSLNVIFSIDQGVTWENRKIAKQEYQRVKYIAKTESYVYVLTTTEKAMSAEAHGLYRSNDMHNFEMVEYADPQARIMTYATFIHDDVGYVAYTQRHMENGENNTAIFYRTTDGGRSFQEITLPIHEVTVLDYTYAPFVQVASIYEEEGRVHVIVGQGDNGDYGSHGTLYQAHYVSEDGIHFTFLEEVLPTRNLAG